MRLGQELSGDLCAALCIASRSVSIGEGPWKQLVSQSFGSPDMPNESALERSPLHPHRRRAVKHKVSWETPEVLNARATQRKLVECYTGQALLSPSILSWCVAAVPRGRALRGVLLRVFGPLGRSDIQGKVAVATGTTRLRRASW